MRPSTPCPPSPTWNNHRVDDEHIGKRLHRFLVHENLVEILGNMKSCVHRTYISDHLSILLKWRMENIHWGIPFKFNRVWLEDKDYNDLVTSTWVKTGQTMEDSGMLTLTHKINIIKSRSRTWEIRKLQQMISELQEITSDISRLGNDMELKNPFQQDLEFLKTLEGKKNEILKIHGGYLEAQKKSDLVTRGRL